MTTTREVQLKSRPVGWPTHDDFELVESAPVDLADGQVRPVDVLGEIESPGL